MLLKFVMEVISYPMAVRSAASESIAFSSPVRQIAELTICKTMPCLCSLIIHSQIIDKKSLQDLILQCRKFRDIFEPILRREFVLRINDKPLEWFKRADFPPGIELTKSFEVLVDDRRAFSPWNSKPNRIYTSFIISMIEKMPILQTFKYVPLDTFVSYLTLILCGLQVA